jgi:hypothetical protein
LEPATIKRSGSSEQFVFFDGMGTLQMRKRDTSGLTDMLPDYKRMNAAGKPQKHLAR